MRDFAKTVAFKNTTHPKSTFDLIRLEEVIQRKITHHNQMKPHKLGFFIILFVTEGTGQHMINFTNYTFKKGTLLSVRKDRIHKFFKTDAKGYLLLFTEDFAVNYTQPYHNNKIVQVFNELLANPQVDCSTSDFDEMLAIIQRIEKEYISRYDEYSLSLIRSELDIFMTKLCRIKQNSHTESYNPEELSQFIAFQEIVESTISENKRVRDYASMMAMSTKVLNRICQGTIQKNAKTFLDETKIMYIKGLLMNTTSSIKEIAFSSGFIEPTNFYKFFKRHTGLTPEQFRQTFS